MSNSFTISVGPVWMQDAVWEPNRMKHSSPLNLFLYYLQRLGSGPFPEKQYTRISIEKKKEEKILLLY